jgi:hypothetical protein
MEPVFAGKMREERNRALVTGSGDVKKRLAAIGEFPLVSIDFPGR